MDTDQNLLKGKDRGYAVGDDRNDDSRRHNTQCNCRESVFEPHFQHGRNQRARPGAGTRQGDGH